MPAALNLLPHGESPERAVGAGGGGGEGRAPQCWKGGRGSTVRCVGVSEVGEGFVGPWGMYRSETE